MKTHETKFTATADKGEVTAILMRPNIATHLLVLGHGAGTNMRHVTMQAYDNPVFVEDVVRNAAALLHADGRVASFTVKAVNHESIHDHNAFAVVSGKAADS